MGKLNEEQSWQCKSGQLSYSRDAQGSMTNTKYMNEVEKIKKCMEEP